jgi:hypothetical protein
MIILNSKSIASSDTIGWGIVVCGCIILGVQIPVIIIGFIQEYKEVCKKKKKRPQNKKPKVLKPILGEY